MASADLDAVTALQELLEERQRYEGWLAVLEGRRGATPRHVYDRVHTDYSLRLERVTERLSERAEQLAGTISSVVARLTALRQRETERTDARHEAELRAIVGEYGAEDWERIRSAADRELEVIGAERASLEREVADMERIVALTRTPSRLGSAAGAPEEAVGDPVEEAGEGAQADGGDAPDSAAGEPELSSSPELPSSPEIPGPPGQPEPTAAGDRDSAASPPAAGWTPAPGDALGTFVPEWPPRGVATGPGTRELASDRAEQGRGAAASAASAEGAQGAGSAGLTRPQDAQSAAPSARPVPPSGDSRRESEKTLKCPECGVLNYATEWYCERCGGELSTF